jgi:hypothetical protein
MDFEQAAHWQVLIIGQSGICRFGSLPVQLEIKAQSVETLLNDESVVGHRIPLLNAGS